MAPPPASSDVRANWRTGWLSSIQELADLETQRAAWLNPQNGNPHFSFVEYLVVYFDDLLLGDAYGGYEARVGEGLLSEEEAVAASDLHAELDRYEPPGGDYDYRAILDDPAWHRVVEAARTAQARLASLIDHSQERDGLLQPSEYAVAAAAIGDG